MEKLTTTKQIVKNVLENDPKTRDCDTRLIIEVLRSMGFKIWVDYSKIKEMPSFESIRRSRQHIQNTLGLFKPTEKISAARDERQEEFKEAFL